MAIFSHGDAVKEKIGAYGFCQRCYKSLVPIGSSRTNGAAHDDWEARQYHKKCWVELKEEETP